MRQFITAIFVTAMLVASTTSQANPSMHLPGNETYGRHIHTERLVLFATVNVAEYATTTAINSPPPKAKNLLPRTKRKQLSLLTQAPVSNHGADDSDDNGADEIECHVAYRRPELVKNSVDNDPDAPLPDYILKRLALARALAMAKYDEKWG